MMSAMSGTRRPHQEGQRDRECDFRDAPAKFMRDRDEDESEEEEVERVQSPAEEAGDERVPLVSGQRLEKPDCFHRVNLALRGVNWEASIRRPCNRALTRARDRFSSPAKSRQRSRARAR